MREALTDQEWDALSPRERDGYPYRVELVYRHSTQGWSWYARNRAVAEKLRERVMPYAKSVTIHGPEQ
jgi:hypothetical protein